jgi:branched-chain amino acid transport system permease protein
MKKQKIPMVVGVLVAALLLVMPLYLTNRYYQNRMAEILIAGILTLSLWIFMGVGEVSFAHSSFMCIGAYTVALFMVRGGISFWLGLPAAGIAAAIIAIPIGFIGLRRVRGVYFFMFSLAVGESIRLVFLYWTKLTGGVNGISGIPRPKLFGINFASPVPYYYLCLAMLLITFTVMYFVWRSQVGVRLRAVRSSLKLAGACGISGFRYRMIAWLICCFFAGIAGGLTTSLIGFVSPHEYVVIKTIYPLTHIIIGGLDSPFGPLVGTGLMMLFSTAIKDIGGAPYWVEPLTYGLVLLIVLVVLRIGIWEFLREKLRPAGATAGS